MDMKAVVSFRGENKPLATNLKVAYQVQGQFNHKSYMDVFASVNALPLNEQVSIIFIAFKNANKDVVVTEEEFFDEYIENHDMSELMDTLTLIMEGIMGKSLMEAVDKIVDASEKSLEEDSKN